MKTPWRIADWNTGKIKITFAAICVIIFAVVGLLRIKEMYRQSSFPRMTYWENGNATVITGGAYRKINNLLKCLDETRNENAALKKRIEELESPISVSVPRYHTRTIQVPGPHYGGEPIYWQTNYIISTP